MKLAISVWVVGVCLVVSSLAGVDTAPRGPEKVQIGGTDYVRLTGWARTNALEVGWVKRDETLQLSKGETRIQVTVDSCEARINAVQVLLLHPLANHNGFIYLSLPDVQTTFRPILSPPKAARGAPRVKTICLDPGHGGKDPGFSVKGHDEKKYTLLLAQEVRQQLLKAGFKVALTRADDSAVELPDRPDVARRRKADLFVSLHFNATESGADTVEGTEVYCLTPPGASSTNAHGEGATDEKFPGNEQNDRNVFLAYQMQKSLTKALGAEDRGLRRARFAVLREARMPAVLIEAGFMSHPDEGKKIFDPAYRRRIARAVVEGIQGYKRAVEPRA